MTMIILFVYFNIHGEIVGLYSDEGHIKGTGNPKEPLVFEKIQKLL
jgi:hypothetical protein